MKRDYSTRVAEFWRDNAGLALITPTSPRSSSATLRRRVLTYPAAEYINGLSDRARKATQRQYRGACVAGGIMIFVRDSRHRVL
jgi:hypothetical protein